MSGWGSEGGREGKRESAFVALERAISRVGEALQVVSLAWLSSVWFVF